MAAELGLSPEILDTESSHPDKRREKLRSGKELLEHLRSRCGQHRSWSDSINAVKINLMSDKRHYDSVERVNIQSCLDKLHRAMKISSQQSLIERLELICRQLGMVFTPPTPPENSMLLSAEMFKVVISLDGQNGIRDVRVGHQDNPSTCEDLVEVLRKGDFDEFVTHIQGLLSIYNITGDKKLKTKGYLALSSLESDLNLLAQLQSSINGVAKYIHKSPLGILLPRRGGHPMKLIYFVSPYDLLCKKTRMSYAMTVEAIAENDVGHSVTVAIEPSSTLNKLQTMPLMSVKQNTEGKSLPSFQAVNSMNSFSLPASFVLVLPQPVPIAKSVISAIQEITGLDVVAGKEQSLLSLILQQCTEGLVTNTKELFVTLPDQQHAYYLNNHGDGCLGQGAALVSKISFTQPTCVPNILNLLRQQLMFNSVMQSLIRPSAVKDYKSSLIFEVTALSLQYVSVMFEHPLQDAMVTAEFDLSDITSVKCLICMNNKDESLCSDEFVSRAFQRSFSIPITLRTVIHKVNEQITKLLPPEPVVKQVARARLKWKLKAASVKISAPTKLSTNSVKQNAVTNMPNASAYSSIGENWVQGSHIDARKFSMPPALNRTFLEPPPPSEELGANPLLATLLDSGLNHGSTDQQLPTHNIASESPMLSKLLEENTSVNSNLHCPPPPSNSTKKRLTKRKSSKDVMAGKSPKIRLSEMDMADRTSGGSVFDRMSVQHFGQGIAEKHIDLDSSGGSYDDPVRPASVSSVGSVGGHSSTGSIIDLTDAGIGESHVKKLENSLDSIMQKESLAGTLNTNTNVNVNSQMAGDFMHMSEYHHGMHPNQMMDGMVGDFAHRQQWGSRQTPPQHLVKNSPHHGLPKNEKISTSLEDLLLGPGGREMEGPNSLLGRRNSAQRRQNLKRQNSLGRNSIDGMMGVLSPDVFSPIMTSPGHHPFSSPSQLPLLSPNQVISPGSYQLSSPALLTASSPNLTPGSHVKSEVNMGVSGPKCLYAANMGRGPVMNMMHHGSSGKPSLPALKAQLEMKNDVNLSGGYLTQEKDIKMEDNYGNNPQSFPPMKLKLNMKLYDTVSPPGSDENKSRTSTFDFHSDDEDFSLPIVDKITIVSSSPTRLQISNKPTLASFNNFNKTEKFKRREREKQIKPSSADSGKRKRVKDESKKERKRKRTTNSEYSIEKEMAVYQSTTVDVQGGSDHYKPITKLKITKSGGKMSVENSSVLKVREVKPEKADKPPRIEKIDKEAVLKIEKVDKISKREEKVRETSNEVKEVKSAMGDSKDREKAVDKVSTARTNTASNNEGIFDKINAMKSESISKGDSDTPKHRPSSVENVKKSSSSKSQKTHKSSSKLNSNSKSLSDSSKVTKTPTIKLKPISVPPNSSSTSSTLQNSPSTPSTPKSIAQSPTSTTIGKIGAVSLATSGSQKTLTPNSSNNSSKVSQQSGSNKMANSTSKTHSSSSQSNMSTTKSSSSGASQKSLSGSSGKNSPILQSSKSAHSRSSSNPNSNLSKSEKGLSKSVSSSNLRTSSPLSEKDRSKSTSGSRNSSSSGRERDKSTSSKNNVPVTTVITQETAASVLSFLNPKANKISSLPPIPKLSSASSGTPKVSTPVSSVSLTMTSSSSTVSNTNTASSSKYGKGNHSSSSNKSSNSFTYSGNKGTNSPNVPGSKGANTQNSFNNKSGSGNYSNSSSNKAQNPALSGNIKNKGSNSPVNFSQKNSANQFNKSVNSNNTQSSGFRNNHSNSANPQRTTGQGNSTNQGQNKANKPPNSYSVNKGGNQNFSNRNNVSSPVNRVNSSASSSSNSNNRPSVSVAASSSNSVTSVNSARGSTSGPNAPRGPGPPHSSPQTSSASVSSVSSESQKAKSSSNSSHSSNVRGRKGSLSAVIDKLTCKASIPVSSDVSTISQISKHVIEESPASPEPESSSNAIGKINQSKDEKKIVIFDAPASPEPEQSSATVKRKGSADGIVSIPLEERRESRENLSSMLAKPSVNGDNNDDKFKKYIKGPGSLSNSPKVIPLNSHSDKASTSHHASSSVSNTKTSFNRQNSVSNTGSYLQQNGDITDSEAKDSARDLKINKICSGQDKTKESTFKVLTPKSVVDSIKIQDSMEDQSNRKSNQHSSSKFVTSNPSSPVSSPENGLVIDFASSPKNALNKTNSPLCNSERDVDKRTPGTKSVHSSISSTSNFRTSPCSPTDVDNLSVEGDSPFLDDDLMDAALVL